MIEAKQTHCGQYKPYGDFSASGTFRQIFRRMKLSNGALKSSITEKFFRFTQNGKQTSPMERPISAIPAITLLVTTPSERLMGGFEFKVCEPFCD